MRLVHLALLATAACETAPVVVARGAAAPTHAPVSTWAHDSASPQSVDEPLEPRVAALIEACGTADAALMRAAAEPDHVEARLRELGSPLVRPRVLTAPADAWEPLKARLQSMHTAHTRCGVSLDGDAATVVSAEALADLAPLPVRARTGAWLTLDATVHVPASSAKVAVLGPRGAPKTYPTAIERGHVRARFTLDQPGAFTVQLLADVEGGPRPLLEARVFADVEPSRAALAAPGEREASLDAMIAAVRSEEGLPGLRRDPRLDALAATHAEQMRKAGRVAHDLGDGDLAQRFQAEGYVASVVGENVARAESLALAHRALYASPSHRMNLLNAQYTRVGLATVTDGPRIWVCEVFSSDLR